MTPVRQATDGAERHAGAVGPLSWAWRAALVAAALPAGAAAGDALARALGLPPSAQALAADPAVSLVAGLAAGALLAVVMGNVARRMPFPFLERAAVLFVLLLALNAVVNVVEALFFTTMPPAELLHGVVAAGVSHALAALLLAWLFPPEAPARRFADAARAFFAARRPGSWAWRVPVAGVLYFPIYAAFGLLVAPVVTPYYDDASLGLGLVIPPPHVMLVLALGRGLLFIASVLPLLVALGGPWTRAWRWLALTLAVTGAWVPMLQVAWWPPLLRATHALEITGDAVVHALVVAWLLVPRDGR